MDDSKREDLQASKASRDRIFQTSSTASEPSRIAALGPGFPQFLDRKGPVPYFLADKMLVLHSAVPSMHGTPQKTRDSRTTATRSSRTAWIKSARCSRCQPSHR